MADAKRDGNYIPAILAVSSVDGVTPVRIVANPTNGKLLVEGVGAGGTAATDDAAFTIAVDSYTPVGGTYKSTLDSVDDGDGGVFHMTIKRALHVNLRDASGNEVSVGGGTQYAEDAASVGGESMTLAGAIRQDTIAVSTSADGDYSNLKVSNVGRLYTSTTLDAALPAGANAIGKLTANGGVIIGDVNIVSNIPGVAATSLGKAEDAVHASGDTGVFILAVRTDTAAASSGTTGDYEALHTDAVGKLWVADNQIEDVAHVSGDRGSFMLGVANEAQTVLAQDGDYIGDAKDTKGNALTVGNLAHGVADAGFPVKVGGQARTTNPTAVADAQRANFITDKLGKVIAVSAIRDLKGTQKTTITSSTAETTIATAVASTFLDIYKLVIANTSATACNVTIKDSTSGTTRYIFAVPAGETRGFSTDCGSATPQATVNNNWTATCSASVASIEISVDYVKNI